MISDFQIDDKTRFLVLYLDAEMKPSRISRILNRPERTIRDWIKKTDEGKDIRVIEGRGPKSSLSEPLKKKILRQVRETPHKASTRKLAAKNGIGKTTIHDLMVQKGLRYGKIDTLPELTAEQREERLDFCNEMLLNNGEKVYQTFFSDEMGIKLSETKKEKAWHMPRKKVKTEKPSQDVKLNCWAAVSAEGATSLKIFKENLRGPLYQSIIEEHIPEMEEMLPDGYYFIHDNHPTHKPIENWMEKNELERLQFPTYSPDLNIIENLWSALKGSVACDAPRTENQLKKSLQKNWETLTTPDNLRPYFANLHDRYFECIEEEGKRLPY